MLIRRLLLVFFSAVVLGGGTVALTVSSATGETCHETVEGPEGDQIEIEIPCSDDGSGGDGGGGDEAADGSNGGGDAEPIGDRKCSYGPSITVDCETAAGTWNGTCYVKVADPQPDKDHPAWGDHEDGLILQCTAYDTSMAEDCDADSGCPRGVSLQWAAGPPDEGPSPAELARRAVAQMNLTAGGIGITPNNDEPAIYGFPTWLWVDNPAENTTGPITTSASDADLTVTATATLDRIEYAMGDGGSVTCAGSDAPGTPYDTSYDPPGHHRGRRSPFTDLRVHVQRHQRRTAR